MKRLALEVACAAAMAVAICGAVQAAEPLKVTVDENNIIHVNGKKFLPIAMWAQPEDTFAMWKDLGANLFMTGSNPRREGTVESYVKAAEENNVYFSIGCRWARESNQTEQVMKHPLLFTMTQSDEPDKPRTVSDAQVEPGKGMKLNRQRPLLNVFDGKLNTSAVIDPPQGIEFTVQLPKAVTATKLAAAVDAGEARSNPKEVEFVADGKSLLKVEWKNAKGLQEFALPQAATFSALTVKILSAYEGKNGYGAIAEVQALDAGGKNLLVSPPRLAPGHPPEEVLAEYKAVKARDPGRLVSMCLMARYMKELSSMQRISDETYKQYPPACDLLMFDLYPVSIWGKNLHWNAAGLDQLRELAGPKKALGIWLQASDAMNAKDPGMTAAQMRADVWLSLIHGATFVGYFPQTFNPTFKFHTLNAERRAAMKANNKEITELADLILTPPKSDLFTVKQEGARVDVMQRESGGKALLVMVNVIESGEGKPVRVTVEPKAFKPAGVPVRYGTKDAVAAKDGAWTLELKPWETAVLVVDRAK